ncbi:MAG: YdcF family protein [Thiohalocapsa sp.]
MLLSKVLTALAMPLGVGLLLVSAGWSMLLFRWALLGGGLVLAGLLWVWLWSTPTFSGWVRGSLEGDYPPLALATLPNAAAVVVLGGAVGGIVPPRLFPDLNAAADRVWHAARVFHAGKAPWLVVSGGRLPWQTEEAPEAVAILAFLEDLGVPPDRVLLEARSGTTRENALETHQLLDQHGVRGPVLLVTSALHMRRALAAFRAAGVDVVPVATDHEVVVRVSRTMLDYLPDAGALSGSSRAFKEYLGLLVYWLRGWAA